MLKVEANKGFIGKVRTSRDNFFSTIKCKSAVNFFRSNTTQKIEEKKEKSIHKKEKGVKIVINDSLMR